jgi:hypothetical protein
LVVGFGDASPDEHLVCLDQLALSCKHIGVITVSGFYVRIKVDGALTPLRGFNEFAHALVGIGAEEHGGIVIGFKFKSFCIALQSVGKIAPHEGSFARPALNTPLERFQKK